jgi:hypothetical protein
MSVGMAMSSIKSIWTTLQDPDISGWDKFSSLLMSTSMALMAITTTLGVLKTIYGAMRTLISGETVAKIANAAATWAQVAAEKSLNRTKGRGTERTRRSIK